MSKTHNKRQIRAWIDEASISRLEMLSRVKNIHLNDAFSHAVDRYLAFESETVVERKVYQKRLLAAKVNSLKTAMQQAFDNEILNDFVEILTRNYIYKRLNKNTLYADFDEQGFFELLNELEKMDKNLFEIIMRFMSDFGKTRNRYRSKQSKL